MTQGTPNYDYALSRAAGLSSTDQPRILDFGCGQGGMIVKGLEQDLDIWGADSYTELYADWTSDVPPTITNRISRIESGSLNYPDQHFDAVISNMVFEHIDDIPPVLAEINRVLKPGGVLLALFPTRETWFEGHVGLYFVHRLDRWPQLQWHCLQICRSFGFGYYATSAPPGNWATHAQKTLNQSCHYHRWRDFRRWLRDSFSSPPQSIETDYMRFRLQQHPTLKKFASLYEMKIISPLLRAICLKRVGRVVKSRKPAQNPD